MGGGKGGGIYVCLYLIPLLHYAEMSKINMKTSLENLRFNFVFSTFSLTDQPPHSALCFSVCKWGSLKSKTHTHTHTHNHHQQNNTTQNTWKKSKNLCPFGMDFFSRFSIAILSAEYDFQPLPYGCEDSENFFFCIENKHVCCAISFATS